MSPSFCRLLRYHIFLLSQQCLILNMGIGNFSWPLALMLWVNAHTADSPNVAM